MRLRTITAIALGLLLGGGGIWAYGSFAGHHAVGAGGLPLIKADTAPLKIAPEKGDEDEIIPNADSTVFGAMGQVHEDAATAADPSLEGVVAPDVPETGAEAEDNMQSSTDFAGFKTGFALPKRPEPTQESLFSETVHDAQEVAPAAGDVAAEAQPEATPPVEEKVEEDVSEENVEEQKIEEETVADVPPPAPPAELESQAQVLEMKEKSFILPVAKPHIEAAPVKEKEAEPAPKPEARKESKAAAPAPVKKEDSAGGYYIQVASAPAGADTGAIWARLLARYGQALSGLSPSVQSVDIHGRGSFARIQAGPVSKGEAEARCARLRELKNPGGCLVLRR